MEHSFGSEKRGAERIKILLFLIFFLILLFPNLYSKEQKEADKIKIITSVFPLQEFAEAVAGERGEVSLLLPPGAEIHTWQPRASDIIRLSSANVFIYVGAALEPWLHDMMKSVKNPEIRILEASQGLSLLGKNHDQPKHKEKKNAEEHNHKHSVIDPHVWLDFKNDQIIVDRIKALLSELVPEDRPFFKRNALIYQKKLQKLDQKYQEGLRNCSQSTFILGGHAAFGYLARRYGLNQIALYGLNPDSKPTPRKLAEIVDLAKEHQIKVIYFEDYFSDDLAKVMAKEVGAETMVLNAGANISKEQLKSGNTFLEIMEKNLENLRHGLNCR
ncbi:MAG: zinc ABC transporter solute-binding protein [Candidatus Aminicenantes bacterium]|nr:zinc ABC transporter solute-binding protein [Candidatus Aminicenantes bacterium]